MNSRLANSPKYISSASCLMRIASFLSEKRPRGIILPRTWIWALHLLEFFAHETPVTPEVLSTRIFWFIRFCDFVANLRFSILLSSYLPFMWSMSMGGHSPYECSHARRWAMKLLPYSVIPIWRCPVLCLRRATIFPARRVFQPLSILSNPGRNLRSFHVKSPVLGSYVTNVRRISAVSAERFDVMSMTHSGSSYQGQAI